MAAITLRPSWDGALLRQEREAAGLTRDDLAAGIDTTSQIIKLWELRGDQYSPSPAVYARLYEFFGVDRWYFAPVPAEDRSLADYRLRTGMTVQDLRETFHVRPDKIKAIESGLLTDVPTEMVEEWASLLGISPVAWLQLRDCRGVALIA
ncbi:MAG: helix-turn-helix domain-containing protein [Micrococcaceae bacterium]